jgi:hypothetical protein
MTLEENNIGKDRCEICTANLVGTSEEKKCPNIIQFDVYIFQLQDPDEEISTE